MAHIRFGYYDPEDTTRCLKVEHQLEEYRNRGWFVPRGNDLNHMEARVVLPKMLVKVSANFEGEYSPGNAYTLADCVRNLTSPDSGHRVMVESLAALDVFDLLCQVYSPERIALQAIPYCTSKPSPLEGNQYVFSFIKEF